MRAIHMTPLSFLGRPKFWLEMITRHEAAWSGGPPFGFDHCVRRVRDEDIDALDLSTWRNAPCGADFVRASTIDDFCARFERAGFRRRAFYACYGLAETTVFATGGDPGTEPMVRSFDARAIEERKVRRTINGGKSVDLVSCGRAADGHIVTIVEPNSLRPLPQGEVGEILVSGPSLAAGYFRSADATDDAFKTLALDGETRRYLRTGDLGFFDGGELFVTGRIKDLIVVAGRNVYPVDVEEVVEESHPLLRENCSAAFGVRDEDRDLLVVVAEAKRICGPEELDEIQRAARREVSRQLGVAISDLWVLRKGGLPKTTSGKVRRSACRSLYLSERRQSEPGSGNTPGDGESAS